MSDKHNKKPLGYFIDESLFPRIAVVAAEFRLNKQEYVELALIKQIGEDELEISRLKAEMAIAAEKKVANTFKPVRFWSGKEDEKDE